MLIILKTLMLVDWEELSIQIIYDKLTFMYIHVCKMYITMF